MVQPEDDTKLNQIFDLVYDELRKLAGHKMEREPAQTIGATALVHEVYLRLQKEGSEVPEKWSNQPSWWGESADSTAAHTTLHDLLLMKRLLYSLG